MALRASAATPQPGPATRSVTVGVVIERLVPALVDADTWDAAKSTVVRNRLFSPRNARRQRLLRGRMKCSLCNLTFIGTMWPYKAGNNALYICNGRHGTRGLYEWPGQRCPSEAVVDAGIEAAVWADVEGFPRKPGQVLRPLTTEADGKKAATVQVLYRFPAIATRLGTDCAPRSA